MSTQPFTSGQFRAFDSNGNPLSGGLLYTYAAGTSTPQSTFTDYGGLTPNANPVVLDSTGAANIWLTPSLLYKFVLQDSLGNVQYTVDNFPASSSGGSGTSIDGSLIDPGGRVTLDPAIPVTTADVTGATTIYYLPYKSAQVPIYDGAKWSLQSIGAGLSQATTDNTKSPLAVVNNSNYDLFIWNDAGVIRLSRGPAWTSDTARGTGVGTTELTQVNGRYVNKNSITNGPAAQLGLYVGTVRSDGSAQINDSYAKRHVWNNYSRKARPMVVVETSTGYSYASATVRQANANAANQLDMVIGLLEDMVLAAVDVVTSGTNAMTIGIGVDSTTAYSTSATESNGFPGGNCGAHSVFNDFVGLGRHLLVWLESAPAGSSSIANCVTTRAGIRGQLFA